jgi:hypothetical protein
MQFYLIEALFSILWKLLPNIEVNLKLLNRRSIIWVLGLVIETVIANRFLGKPILLWSFVMNQTWMFCSNSSVWIKIIFEQKFTISVSELKISVIKIKIFVPNVRNFVQGFKIFDRNWKFFLSLRNLFFKFIIVLHELIARK